MQIYIKYSKLQNGNKSYSLSNKKPTFIPVNDLLKVVRLAIVVFDDDAPKVWKSVRSFVASNEIARFLDDTVA